MRTLLLVLFFALTLASAVATYLAQDTAGATFKSIPLDLRVANAAISVVRYLGTFVWPFGLSVIYPYPATWPAGAVAAALAVLLCLTGGRCGRRGRVRGFRSAGCGSSACSCR